MQLGSGAVSGALVALASLVALVACSAAPDPAAPPAASSSAGSSSAAARTTAPTTASAPASAARVGPVAVAPVAVAKPSARPKPKPVNHCAHNTSAQKVIVSLAAQHMWLCAKSRTVRGNPITSGMSGQYTETPTGNYVIQGRSTDTVLTLNTGQTYPVRYWIPFDGPLFGFHDSSWQHFPYGSEKYKTEGSHGCIHMPLQAIAFLYRWSARMTTDVHIA